MQVPIRFLLRLALIAFSAFSGTLWCAPGLLAAPTDSVDPMIGVDGGGNIFPGPTLPFGMVKLGPDTTENSNAGYSSGGDILGFSHVHVSGTGGGPKYGVILMCPTTGPIDLAHYGSPRAAESASVGYYGVTLTRYHIKAELSASRRTGFHRYVFPASTDAHILIDAGHFLSSGFAGESQSCDGGAITVVSPTLVEGYGRFRGGWNKGAEYRVFFSAGFDTPSLSNGTWKAADLHAGSTSETDTGAPVGAFLNYHTHAGQAIQAKVGISFIGVRQARENAAKEVRGWSFEAVRKAALRTWNEALDSIQVEGGTPDQRKIFYTALYHSMMQPTDRTGENPGWKSQEPYYDDYYAIWDTYRCVHPLLTLIQARRQVDMVRSLVDIYRHTGYMPDARSGNDNGRTQGGSNADVIIADAFVKGLKSIDYNTAFHAMEKDAEAPPPDPQKEGRGGLAEYNIQGYVPASFERSGTRTVEYSTDDFAIAQVARGLRKLNDYRTYLRRCSNWTNLWNNAVTDHGATGFVMPRNADGSWFSPFTVFTGGSWSGVFYEGDSWIYSLSIPQDVRLLVQKCGGPDAFYNRLETLFNNGYYDVTNEPSFLDPMLYLWIGRQDRTSDRVRHILNTNYNASRSGIPGNDDSGAMSSWYVFNAMGFYPNAGQDVYLITSPEFSKVDLRLETGSHFNIICHGLAVGDVPSYIQSATLNGHALERAWLHHAEIAHGGTLVLEMGPKPSTWGQNNPPPSASDPPSKNEGP